MNRNGVIFALYEGKYAFSLDELIFFKMKYLFIILFGFISPEISAQRVFEVDRAYNADLKVFVVDRDYNADLLVFEVDRDYNARGNDGRWFFVDRAYNADLNIFFVDRDYNADLNIFYVDREYNSGWRNEDKKLLFEEVLKR